MTDTALLIGPGGQISSLSGPRGETPPCPSARFQRGAVVKVRRNKRTGHMPSELVVLVAIPPGFSPDHALADLLGKPRPLLAQVGSRRVTYILAIEGNPKPYLLSDRDILPSGKPAVEIGSVKVQADD